MPKMGTDKAARLYLAALTTQPNAWGVHYLDDRPVDEFIRVCVGTYGRDVWWAAVAAAGAQAAKPEYVDFIR